MMHEDIVEVLEIAQQKSLENWLFNKSTEIVKEFSASDIRSLVEIAWHQGYNLSQQEHLYNLSQPESPRNSPLKTVE